MTGALGKFTPKMKLMEVAGMLGSPQYWLVGKNEGPYPLYWGYNDDRRGADPSIEIAFREEPPHAMKWFQFEHADCFSEDVHLFGDVIAVSMDGFTGKTRASELIASGVWDPRNVKVCYQADIEMLVVTAGQVAVHYMLECDEADKLDGARKTELQEAFGRTALFAEIDARYMLNSIYSYPARTLNDPAGKLEMSICTGEQYLRSLQS